MQYYQIFPDKDLLPDILIWKLHPFLLIHKI
jgi:hypothetical protein